MHVRHIIGRVAALARMGAVAAELADFTLLTSDNPRRESAEDIVAQIAAGFGAASAERFRIDGVVQHGLPGLTILAGIESPGLTSSLAIGEMVASMY